MCDCESAHRQVVNPTISTVRWSSSAITAPAHTKMNTPLNTQYIYKDDVAHLSGGHRETLRLTTDVKIYRRRIPYRGLNTRIKNKF